jgi:hypothetical protein
MPKTVIQFEFGRKSNSTQLGSNLFDRFLSSSLIEFRVGWPHFLLLLVEGGKRPLNLVALFGRMFVLKIVGPSSLNVRDSKNWGK